MRLQDIMSTDIKTIASTATLGQARSLMRQNGVHHLLVVDGPAVVGIVSDRDLGGPAVARRGFDIGSVAEVMNGDVVSAAPDTTVREAANLMRGRGIGCLAVVQRGRPVGVLTTTDLLELIGRGVERPIERSTRWTLRRRGARATGPTARRARRG